MEWRLATCENYYARHGSLCWLENWRLGSGPNIISLCFRASHHEPWKFPDLCNDYTRQLMGNALAQG
jgi:hypothetical protein